MKLKQVIGILFAFAATQTVILAYQTPKEPSAPARTDQTQKVEFIAAEELKKRIANKNPVTIVDVRGQTAYLQSEKIVQGAMHSQVRRVVHRLREVPRESEVVTYCACPADEAAIIAARSLMTSGFKNVRVLKGGWNAWLEAGGQLQPSPK
ncbi:MAG TPA: rhodanese-like domain-containing protein [Blastocatellia bacterium]|nr:rhodanese-like domain-containing protein [Blastocatellia bacterium]